MKKIAIIILISFNSVVLSQYTDSLGVDDTSDRLNKYEIEILNYFLNETQSNFDFKDKKIAFITGNSADRILTKKEYFDTCIIPWLKKDTKPQIFIEKLTPIEKIDSGGYDVLIMSWVKFFNKKKKKKIIKELKNHE